ncbi:hypothetical protein HMN09_00838700 [Mycena chlorophos]|uniref:Uncharacterized protein n=1 Tax=Mycena chlorophos TaxID=658473 RepID=A0A8H6W489_MYCCL|nr:hypothetical protein HMN09_00838700 [Mycena chlorophos]
MNKSAKATVLGKKPGATKKPAAARQRAHAPIHDLVPPPQLARLLAALEKDSALALFRWWRQPANAKLSYDELRRWLHAKGQGAGKFMKLGKKVLDAVDLLQKFVDEYPGECERETVTVATVQEDAMKMALEAIAESEGEMQGEAKAQQEQTSSSAPYASQPPTAASAFPPTAAPSDTSGAQMHKMPSISVLNMDAFVKETTTFSPPLQSAFAEPHSRSHPDPVPASSWTGTPANPSSTASPMPESTGVDGTDVASAATALFLAQAQTPPADPIVDRFSQYEHQPPGQIDSNVFATFASATAPSGLEDATLPFSGVPATHTHFTTFEPRHAFIPPAAFCADRTRQLIPLTGCHPVSLLYGPYGPQLGSSWHTSSAPAAVRKGICAGPPVRLRVAIRASPKSKRAKARAAGIVDNVLERKEDSDAEAMRRVGRKVWLTGSVSRALAERRRTGIAASLSPLPTSESEYGSQSESDYDCGTTEDGASGVDEEGERCPLEEGLSTSSLGLLWYGFAAIGSLFRRWVLW